MIWNYMQPVTIHFGSGRIHELGSEIEKLGGRKGILITSPSFVKRGVAEKVRSDSDGRIAVVFSGVSPNPDVQECEACVRLIRENECDFVVALGGGSVLDCAKAAAVMCTAEHPVRAYMQDAGLLPDTRIPLIAVPTTAGTGSEITCVSVLSDHEMALKKPLVCDGFYPVLALVDPELTYSVPRHITACTGMDVFCHAIEAYWSKNHQPVCDALAVHALRLVLGNLRIACDEPDNAEAREKMAEASVIAGLSFNMPKTNCSHVCSYPLTNMLGIPHGEACALTIDHFLRINAEADADGRIGDLARMLGYENAMQMADAITELKQYIGVMPDLKQFNLDDERLEKLVQASKHPNLRNNPVEITEEMLREMYQNLR